MNNRKFFYFFFCLFFIKSCAWAFFFDDAKHTTLQIKTTDSANQSSPFYLLIKPTTFAQFIKDDYSNIVAEKLQKDTNFLYSTCLLPNETRLIKLKTPPKEPFAIYCIFKKPGENWKYFIDAEGPNKMKILITQNEIQAISRF